MRLIYQYFVIVKLFVYIALYLHAFNEYVAKYYMNLVIEIILKSISHIVINMEALNENIVSYSMEVIHLNHILSSILVTHFNVNISHLYLWTHLIILKLGPELNRSIFKYEKKKF